MHGPATCWNISRMMLGIRPGLFIASFSSPVWAESEEWVLARANKNCLKRINLEIESRKSGIHAANSNNTRSTSNNTRYHSQFHRIPVQAWQNGKMIVRTFSEICQRNETSQNYQERPCLTWCRFCQSLQSKNEDIRNTQQKVPN